MFKANQSTAICPFCYSNLNEDDTSIFCTKYSESKCNFKIFNTINGKKINLEDFLTFQKKCSNSYRAYKKIHDTAIKKEKEYFEKLTQMKRHREQLVRERLAKKDNFFATSEEVGFYCPNCTALLHINKDILKCTNESCNYTISKNCYGVRFSNEEMRELLIKTISKEYVFKIKNQERTGMVYIDFNPKNYKMTSNYIFINNLSEIPKNKRARLCNKK